MELTKDTREERPAQNMNRHVPAPQLEASVRCQVSGTDAEVKAKSEKTVNAWLAAVIFQVSRGDENQREAPGKLEGEALETVWPLRWKQLDGLFQCAARVDDDRDTRTTSGIDTTQYLRSGIEGGSSEPVMQATVCTCDEGGEETKGRNARRGMGRAMESVWPQLLIVIVPVKISEL